VSTAWSESVSVTCSVGELAQARARRAHLAQVAQAGVAVDQVPVDRRPPRRRQRTLEVLGDQLDELLAGDVARVVMSAAASQAARSRARPRCSRTRWLAA
jgi:hypothetical protein